MAPRGPETALFRAAAKRTALMGPAFPIIPPYFIFLNWKKLPGYDILELFHTHSSATPCDTCYGEGYLNGCNRSGGASSRRPPGRTGSIECPSDGREITMKICGLQKTTLLDFPGKVAATVFLGGCNFRCPFCHNSGLLTDQAEEQMSRTELLKFLDKRAGVLDGVCVSGGEPTLYPEELENLLRAVRALGYAVKLDTNGYRPRVLKDLCGKGLLDYVAMDIKAGRGRYREASGTPGLSMEPILESADYLMGGPVPYEFRTTVVKGIHTAEDFIDIARWLGGCEAYFLQGFVDSEGVPTRGLAPYSRAELEEFLAIVRTTVPQAEIRGVDS